MAQQVAANTGVKRAATFPTRLQRPGLDVSTADESNDVDTLYAHPNVKIVRFPTSGSRPSSSSGRPKQEPAGTLPWASRHERTVAIGPLSLYRLKSHGNVTFLKSGDQLLHFLPRSQCWCVDDKDKFAMRIQKDTYRFEFPSDSETEKAMVEDFKNVLSRVLLYERTSCPFDRHFKVDLEDEPDLSTPMKVTRRSSLNKTGLLSPTFLSPEIKRWRSNDSAGVLDSPSGSVSPALSDNEDLSDAPADDMKSSPMPSPLPSRVAFAAPSAPAISPVAAARQAIEAALNPSPERQARSITTQADRLATPSAQRKLSSSTATSPLEPAFRATSQADPKVLPTSPQVIHTEELVVPKTRNALAATQSSSSSSKELLDTIPDEGVVEVPAPSLDGEERSPKGDENKQDVLANQVTEPASSSASKKLGEPITPPESDEERSILIISEEVEKLPAPLEDSEEHPLVSDASEDGQQTQQSPLGREENIRKTQQTEELSNENASPSEASFQQSSSAIPKPQLSTTTLSSTSLPSEPILPTSAPSQPDTPTVSLQPHVTEDHINTTPARDHLSISSALPTRSQPQSSALLPSRQLRKKKSMMPDYLRDDVIPSYKSAIGTGLISQTLALLSGPPSGLVQIMVAIASRIASGALRGSDAGVFDLKHPRLQLPGRWYDSDEEFSDDDPNDH